MSCTIFFALKCLWPCVKKQGYFRKTFAVKLTWLMVKQTLNDSYINNIKPCDGIRDHIGYINLIPLHWHIN